MSIVFNELGIDCNYVWGHFNVGTENEPQYVGHRWNVVAIGDKNYMVDFTAGMIMHNLSKDSNYASAALELLGANSESSEYDYLFFDKLAPTETIGGFKKNENGTSVDDLDEFGKLKNVTTEPASVIDDLGTIPKDYIIKHVDTLDSGKML